MSVPSNEFNTFLTDRSQLVEYFTKAAKPKAEWLIGCEHEMFPYRLSTLGLVSDDEPKSIHDFLVAMQDFGWRPVEEDGNSIGLERGNGVVNLESSNSLQFITTPVPTLHETAAELDQYLVEACEIGEKLDMGFLSMGFHPTATRADISWTPKGRYLIMSHDLPKRGKLGLDTMFRTCDAEARFDFSDEADMIKKFRVALALQPIATALFASSPFTEGNPNGFLSYRMHAWMDTDPARCGAPAFVFDEDFGYTRYVNYALDVPMHFIIRDGHYIDCTGQSFRDFMMGKLPAQPGELPTFADWDNHLSTIFTDVRLKKTLELRGADACSTEMLLALPSFWTGLLYDSATLESAWEMVKGWTAEERAQLHVDVPRVGFEADVRGVKVYSIAQDALVLAQQGLRRRANRLHGGADETRYLDILFNYTESRHSMADQLLMQHRHNKDFSTQKLFDICRLTPPPKRERDSDY